jgi:hypothetical protein
MGGAIVVAVVALLLIVGVLVGVLWLAVALARRLDTSESES